LLNFSYFLFCVVVVGSLLAFAVEGNHINYAAVVDYNPTTGNILIRSSTATELVPKPHFNYTGMVYEFRLACEAAGVPFPTNFTIQSVNLLSFAPELAELELEKEFFATHPELGSVAHFPLRGIYKPSIVEKGCTYAHVSNCDMEYRNYGQPRNFSDEERTNMALSFGVDWATDEQLEQHADQIHEWMITPAKVPRIIAIHCHFGTDRTGEMVAAYEMKYLHTPLQKFLQRSNELTGRGLIYCYQLICQWLCVRLNVMASKPVDECLACNSIGTDGSCLPDMSFFWCL